MINKSGLTLIDFESLLNLMLTKVKIIPFEILENHKKEALEIAKSIDDLDDVSFIACALAYPGSMIWSNDTDLKRQTKVKVVNTKELFGSFSS